MINFILDVSLGIMIGYMFKDQIHAFGVKIRDKWNSIFK